MALPVGLDVRFASMESTEQVDHDVDEGAADAPTGQDDQVAAADAESPEGAPASEAPAGEEPDSPPDPDDDREWDAFAVLRVGDTGGFVPVVSRALGYGDLNTFEQVMLDEVNERRRFVFDLDEVDELSGKDWALVMPLCELGDGPSDAVGQLRRLLGVSTMGRYDEALAAELAAVVGDPDNTGHICDVYEWMCAIDHFKTINEG